jgi:hypothetical protein
MAAGLSRRTLLAGAACLLAARAGRAHTPYRQWDVYRRKHLLIGTCRADPQSYPLGQRLVSILAVGLPDSKARVTRAPNQMRLASLLTTGQLDLVVFEFGEAVALAGGNAPFAEFGPYPVRLVFEVDGYALVCGDEFPARHAWLVTRTLADQLPVSKSLTASHASELAVHAGSRTFLAGGPQPE